MNVFRFILTAYALLLATSSFPQTRPQRFYNSVEDASQLMPGENIDEKIKKNFFLRAEVTKDKCFVGEGIMAVFKAYSRLDANSQVLKRPSLSGFSVIEMVDAYNNQPDVEKYNGSMYYVHLIRKVQLFPIQPGDYTIEPAEVESMIQFRKAPEKGKGIRLRDLFRRSHSDPSLQRQVTFSSPEMSIHVNALPAENQPDDFSGAVGNFNVHLAMDDTAVLQHEPVTVKLIVSGTGNFPLITDPDIAWPEGMQVSGPAVSEETNRYEYPLSGFKVFQYTFDNKDTGRYTIPPVKFSFFDLASKTYKTVESKELSYTVSLNRRKRPFIPSEIFRRDPDTPLQYYYFGIIVVIITAVIVFLAVRKPKKKS